MIKYLMKGAVYNTGPGGAWGKTCINVPIEIVAYILSSISIDNILDILNISSKTGKADWFESTGMRIHIQCSNILIAVPASLHIDKLTILGLA